MAFKEVIALDADTTISLGGVNKKLNKPNPKSIEGYFLGRRQIEDIKKKNGVSYIYIFKTQTGNVGVWGKTDLDRKMQTAQLGVMTRVSYVGMKKIPGKQDMYQYKVEVDNENTVEVDLQSASTPNDYTSNDDTLNTNDTEYGDTLDAEDFQPVDEVQVPRATRPAIPARTPSAEQQAKVKALLSGNKRA